MLLIIKTFVDGVVTNFKVVADQIIVKNIVKFLKSEFASSFGLSDTIVLCPVYSAGEKAIKGINSQSILEAIKNKGKKKLFFASSIEHAIELIETFIPNEKGILLIQGAGSISKISQELLEKIGKQ